MRKIEAIEKMTAETDALVELILEGTDYLFKFLSNSFIKREIKYILLFMNFRSEISHDYKVFCDWNNEK